MRTWYDWKQSPPETDKTIIIYTMKGYAIGEWNEDKGLWIFGNGNICDCSLCGGVYLVDEDEILMWRYL